MSDELARVVGQQIRARRLAAGMRYQRELADRMKAPTISNQTISDWERGVHKPSDENLRELAEIFDCDVSEFYVDAAKLTTPDPFARVGSGPEKSQLDRIEQQISELAEQIQLLRAETTAGAAAALQRIDEALPPTQETPRRRRQ